MFLRRNKTCQTFVQFFILPYLCKFFLSFLSFSISVFNILNISKRFLTFPLSAIAPCHHRRTSQVHPLDVSPPRHQFNKILSSQTQENFTRGEFYPLVPRRQQFNKILSIIFLSSSFSWINFPHLQSLLNLSLTIIFLHFLNFMSWKKKWWNWTTNICFNCWD